MGFARKIRKKRQRPPLSALDKFIYYSGFVVSIGIAFLLFYNSAYIIPNKVAFADNSVIALSINYFTVNHAAILMLLVTINIVLPLSLGLQNKQPIFGNKHFKPSSDFPTEKVCPLFTKEFRDSISVKRKKKIKKFVLLFCVIYMISAIILPLSFNHRSVLHKNNDCSTYNAFGKVTHEQNITEAEKMIIKVDHRIGTRTGHISYNTEISFVFESKQYNFNLSWFDMTTEKALKHAIYLKGFFKDGKYEIVNANDIDNLLRDNTYTSAEAALVYQLFDYK